MSKPKPSTVGSIISTPVALGQRKLPEHSGLPTPTPRPLGRRHSKITNEIKLVIVRPVHTVSLTPKKPDGATLARSLSGKGSSAVGESSPRCKPPSSSTTKAGTA